MRVAFIGQKGIPAVFGGVESHVDELSRQVVRAGEAASVYVRNWYTPPRLAVHGGVKLIHLPTIRTKHLDAAVHSLLASLHCLFTDARVIHYHGIGPAAFGVLPRLFSRRVVVTVHRLDWAADKWTAPARLVLKLAEAAAVRVAHRLVAVSDDIGRYLIGRYGVRPEVIPNGVPSARPRPPGRMAVRFGLEKEGYILFLGRLVPEKRPDWLIRAFLASGRVPAGLKLVLAGGPSGTKDYAEALKASAAGDARVVFTGTVTGEDKEELLSNALLFVLPSRLEGFPIALLEARSYGLGCLASDITPHAEIIRHGYDGLLFRSDDPEDLAGKLGELARDPALARQLGQHARGTDAGRPGWEAVAARTLAVYRSVAG